MGVLGEQGMVGDADCSGVLCFCCGHRSSLEVGEVVAAGWGSGLGRWQWMQGYEVYIVCLPCYSRKGAGSGPEVAQQIQSWALAAGVLQAPYHPAGSPAGKAFLLPSLPHPVPALNEGLPPSLSCAPISSK